MTAGRSDDQPTSPDILSNDPPCTDISLPDPTAVLELLAAYRKSKTMFAAVELGVFDALRGSAMTAEQLAEKLRCQPEALSRLLSALAGLRLLVFADGTYVNTDTAEAYLTSDSPRRFTGYIRYSNTVGWKLWHHLEDAVREGTHRWQQAFGWDGPIFDQFFKTDEAKTEFLMGMHGFGVLSSPAVVEAFDLSQFRCMVDLGTASGHLVLAACQRYPQLRAVAFDLPDALPLARRMISASPHADRIDLVGGDFFQDPLPSGDLYALGRIVHDWSDDKIDVLLAKIHAALPPGGGLLIAEKILLADHSGPSWGQMQDLNMLVCTEGRERTLAEYAQLLHRAGFDSVSGCRTATPIDAVLAIKSDE